MVLYFIGLGLDSEKDITLKGLEAAKKCESLFLESYTSRLNVRVDKLEGLYGKKIIAADRTLVEKHAGRILDEAGKKDIGFLVVGDVFSATTHTDLFLRAREKGIAVKVIHNASVLTAVGSTGLELYKFGKTTSMPYFEKSFEPQTPYDSIIENRKQGLHTLVLLDIKAEQDRFMTIKEAIMQFYEIEKSRKEKIFTQRTKVVGCARLGSDTEEIRYGTAEKISSHDFGRPLHCLIVPGKLHFMEEEMLRQWMIK